MSSGNKAQVSPAGRSEALGSCDPVCHLEVIFFFCYWDQFRGTASWAKSRLMSQEKMDFLSFKGGLMNGPLPHKLLIKCKLFGQRGKG